MPMIGQRQVIDLEGPSNKINSPEHASTFRAGGLRSGRHSSANGLPWLALPSAPLFTS